MAGERVATEQENRKLRFGIAIAALVLMALQVLVANGIFGWYGVADRLGRALVGDRGVARRHRGRGRRGRPRDRQLPVPGRAAAVRVAGCSYWGDERSALRHRRRRARGRGPEEIPPNAPLAVRMRPRTLDEMVGQEHIVGEGSALRAAIESGRPHSAILYGPPGSGEDDAGADRGADGRRRLRGGVGGERRQSGDPRGDRAGAGAAALLGPADDPLPRRDPPLQQGPAGRAAAGGRGRAPDPDRGDHREPLLRGERRADLPQPGLRAGAAVPGAGGSDPAPRARRSRARDRRPAADRRRRPGDAGRAQRRRRPRGPLGPGAGGRAGRAATRSTSPRSRTRCSAGRSPTTARATATTTSSPPGSSPPAAPTSTPRSTTWG